GRRKPAVVPCDLQWPNEDSRWSSLANSGVVRHPLSPVLLHASQPHSKSEGGMPSLDGANILVVGGAGFVGSHIVDQLTRTGAKRIVVLDNYARGTRANLAQSAQDRRVEIIEGSITDLPLLHKLMKGQDY